MGLAVNPSQPRSTHTLKHPAGEAGCDCLGCNIARDPTQRTRLGFQTSITPTTASVKAQQRQRRDMLARHKTAPHAALLKALHGGSRGWRHSCSTVCRKEPDRKADRKLGQRRRSWGRFRHPQQPRPRAARTEWRRQGDTWHVSPSHRDTRVCFHRDTRSKSHGNIHGNRSPDDGDGVDGSTRLGRHPGVSPRRAMRLKRHDGRGAGCGRHCTAREVLEVEHRIPTSPGGTDVSTNWPLLHGHGHDGKRAEDGRRYA
jgi:RNA-directed DNA polymerase